MSPAPSPRGISSAPVREGPCMCEVRMGLSPSWQLFSLLFFRLAPRSPRGDARTCSQVGGAWCPLSCSPRSRGAHPWTTRGWPRPPSSRRLHLTLRRWSLHRWPTPTRRWTSVSTFRRWTMPTFFKTAPLVEKKWVMPLFSKWRPLLRDSCLWHLGCRWPLRQRSLEPPSSPLPTRVCQLLWGARSMP